MFLSCIRGASSPLYLQLELFLFFTHIFLSISLFILLGVSSFTHPLAWECLPLTYQTLIPSTMNITSDSVALSFSPNETVPSALQNYVYPETLPRTFGWAAYNSLTGILTLRFSPTEVQCHYARIIGEGDQRQLVLVTIGGGAYTWESQCDVTQYRLPQLLTTSAPTTATNFPGTILETMVSDALANETNTTLISLPSLLKPFCERQSPLSNEAYATNVVAYYHLYTPPIISLPTVSNSTLLMNITRNVTNNNLSLLTSDSLRNQHTTNFIMSCLIGLAIAATIAQVMLPRL